MLMVDKELPKHEKWNQAQLAQCSARFFAAQFEEERKEKILQKNM